MRTRFYVVRMVELGITIVTSILAIQSFFRSSSYEYIQIVIHEISLNYQIEFIPASFNIEATLPIFITILTIALTIYYGVFGGSAKVINIYYFNLLLIFPEILSYSKLNWLMLFDISSLFNPRRPRQHILNSGLVIIAGYLILLFISRSRESIDQIRTRGASQQTADNIYTYQAGAAVALITVSFLLTLTISMITSTVKGSINSLFRLIPYPYLILGIISSLTISAGLLIFFRESTS